MGEDKGQVKSCGSRRDLEQERQFLFDSFFGLRGSEFDRFIERAYRDWSRTFRGVAKLSDDANEHSRHRKSIFDPAKACLHKSFQELESKTAVGGVGQRFVEFDSWHRNACCSLRDCLNGRLMAISSLQITFGQSQKWINMVMKYCWVCGGSEFDWCERWFAVAHVPVDQIILKAALAEQVVPKLPCKSWSTWDNYEEYLTFQHQLRSTAAKRSLTPLQLEFEWWEKYSTMTLRMVGDSQSVRI